MYDNREKLLRWLKVLFYIQLASTLLLTLTLASTMFGFTVGSWYTWAQRAVSLGVAVSLYLLPSRYRLAGMAKALSLMCILIALAFYPVLYALGVQLTGTGYAKIYALLAGASEVLALIAMSLEYIMHAVNSREDKTKWHILLGCSLAISLLSSVAVALLQPVLNDMAQAGELWLIKLWNVSARSLSLGVSVIYLVLLHRMIRKQEEVD